MARVSRVTTINCRSCGRQYNDQALSNCPGCHQPGDEVDRIIAVIRQPRGSAETVTEGLSGGGRTPRRARDEGRRVQDSRRRAWMLAGSLIGLSLLFAAIFVGLVAAAGGINVLALGVVTVWLVTGVGLAFLLGRTLGRARSNQHGWETH